MSGLQGDIEKVASRTPEQLTQLFEQISGSDALAKDYAEAAAAKEKAEASAALLFAKKKAVAAERKQKKEQKEEAERHMAALQEQVCCRGRCCCCCCCMRRHGFVHVGVHSTVAVYAACRPRVLPLVPSRRPVSLCRGCAAALLSCWLLTVLWHMSDVVCTKQATKASTAAGCC